MKDADVATAVDVETADAADSVEEMDSSVVETAVVSG